MFYRFIRLTCRMLLFFMRRWEVHGKEHIPAAGGLVVAANHTSYWDPPVVGCITERPVYFMAKSELFAIPLIGTSIKRLGAFPVHRNSLDRAAVRTALKYLAEGKVVGIFPEGTRSHTGELLQPYLGAAMLVLKSNVPVLPVAISGSRGVWGKVRVFIGKPLYFSADGNSRLNKSRLEDVSRRIMSEIAGLLAGIKQESKG
ncbi:MAG: 1-acyl-sn-glycerol-3-phosphate acyltransferase [Peptococcaceae bacterium]|nr:MAG: 1-acyl-sn-glycerol-3-phosphate acyltransferase [Peptococcaceae bacterium]